MSRPRCGVQPEVGSCSTQQQGRRRQGRYKYDCAYVLGVALNQIFPTYLQMLVYFYRLALWYVILFKRYACKHHQRWEITLCVFQICILTQQQIHNKLVSKCKTVEFNNQLHHIPHICHFFTQAKLLENKIYNEIYTVNCQFTQ